MTDKEIELHERIAEMEGDVRAVVLTLLAFIKSFGVNFEDFKESSDIMQKLPGVLGKVSMQLVSGTFDHQAVANLSSLSPILEKYKHLLENPKDEQA
jgi:hypothetical protein